jgi:hypothetical protein
MERDLPLVVRLVSLLWWGSLGLDPPYVSISTNLADFGQSPNPL